MKNHRVWLMPITCPFSLSLSLSGLFFLPQSLIHHYQVCGEKVERVGRRAEKLGFHKEVSRENKTMYLRWPLGERTITCFCFVLF